MPIPAGRYDIGTGTLRVGGGIDRGLDNLPSLLLEGKTGKARRTVVTLNPGISLDTVLTSFG